LTDLRSEKTKYPDSQQKAKALLHEMGLAHGISTWDSIQSYNAIYGDDFYGFLGTQSHKRPGRPTRYKRNKTELIFQAFLEFFSIEYKSR